MGRPDRYAGRNRAQIASVITKVSMQAGSRPYYDVLLVQPKESRLPPPLDLQQARAEWLAASMKTSWAIGLAERGSRRPQSLTCSWARRAR